MSSKIDHDKLCRVIKGRNGRDIEPHFNKRNFINKPSTKTQVEYIEDMCKTLEEHGIAYKYITEDPKWKWKVYQNDARFIIRCLQTIKRNNGLFSDVVTIHYNLVKDSDGKRYEYLTKRIDGRPKGYTLIGELKRERVQEDEFNSWPIEKRLREFKKEA